MVIARRRSSRIGLLILVIFLLVPGTALAAETNVYGDPGSGNFSVALAVAADTSGNAYVMGAFFGDFQGTTSSQWDLWVARVGDDGSLAWLQTWDAPETDSRDFSGFMMGAGPWTTGEYELIVDSSDRIRGRIGLGRASLVSVNLDGSDPSYSYVEAGLTRPTLVKDGTGDIVGIGNVAQQLVLTRVDSAGSPVWVSSADVNSDSPVLVTQDGSVVVGRQLERLSFQTPALAVTAVDGNGDVTWKTEIFDACFQGHGNPLIDMGGEIGILSTPAFCGADTGIVTTLSVQTGARLSHRVMKDTLNIFWCEDPRLGPITDATPIGFVDGDECGGDDVFWTDVNNNLISEGSSVEGFSLMGMELAQSGHLGYGVLRTVVEGDRWKLDRFDYLGPSSGFIPYDMVMAKNGAVVVGRAFNTAWFTANTYEAAAVNEADQGAAALVTVNVHSSRTFLPDGHTIGLIDPIQGKWHLYDDTGETAFFFGNPGDYPFMGDWDGDGIETPGLYRQSDGYVYLRNTNTQGTADIKFFFGNPGDIPIAGDFNGDGFDTVSIYRPSEAKFHIINKLGSSDRGLGAADVSYVFGNPGDNPFSGDFDGDGIETVGLHRESNGLVYFRNTHTQGNADNQFIFGDPGDRFVAGDWTGNGEFSPALFRPANTTTYFRFTNTQGNADYDFTAGQTDWLPVAGHTAP